jgi:toxin HigB-1
VIQSFRCKETEKLWRQEFSRKLPRTIQQRALDKLQILDAATRLEILAINPGNRLETLKGDRQGQHSIRINDQWRICFVWHSGHAHDVEIIDYH